MSSTFGSLCRLVYLEMGREELGKSPRGDSFLPDLASSFASRSRIAEEALAQDIAECSDEGDEVKGDDQCDEEHHPHHSYSASYEGGHSMYRRFGGVSYGVSRPHFDYQTDDEPAMAPQEMKQSRAEERSLLRDNHILPPKHPERYIEREEDRPVASRMYRKLFSTKLPQGDEETFLTQDPTETSPLLAGKSRLTTTVESIYSDSDAGHSEDVDDTWEQAVASGRIRSTWQREAKTITSYSGPLVITFFLQYSVNVAAIFAVGRIGTTELGAVSGKFLLQHRDPSTPYQRTPICIRADRAIFSL